jgi:hypothetical protein
MMQYSYCYQYDTPNSIGDQLRLHFQVFTIADKYAVNYLLHYCTAKFEWTVNEYWNSRDIPEAIRYVYEATPNGRFRDILASKTSLTLDVMIQRPGFQAVVDDEVEFSRDVAYELLKEKERLLREKNLKYELLGSEIEDDE